MQQPYILALDIGTSSVRALLFDATASAVPNVYAQHTYTLTTSNEGEVSVDADTLVKAVAGTIDEALAAAGSLAAQIGGVATSTFWHSLVGVDDAGYAVMPLLTWEDTRALHAAAELRGRLDEVAVHARTGARLHASYWPAKLHWLSTTQQETFARVSHWLSFGEYLHQQFLGRSICSLSMASGTGMLATRSRTWDAQLLSALKVHPEAFPPLGDVQDSLQGLLPAYAERWPALRDVPWFPAPGDGAAANIGSGCVTPENLAITIGTSSAIRAVVPVERVVPPMGLWLYLVDAQRGLLGGALSEGGNLLSWLQATLRLPSLKEAEPLVTALKPDGHGLTMLPFISGERSPDWHAEARAAILGLHVGTSPAEILRAGMEALAYQLGAVYEQLCSTLAVGTNRPRLIGSGGALLNSPILQQIIADTLNVPLYPSHEHEASSRGVAVLALEALGILSPTTLSNMDLAPPVQPDSARHSIYARAAAHQRDVYRLLLDHA